MILMEIALGQTEESRREVVQRRAGQQVIIHDEHNYWCHGVILKDGLDNQVYQMKIADGRGQRQLHYNDLNKLLDIDNHSDFPAPKID